MWRNLDQYIHRNKIKIAINGNLFILFPLAFSYQSGASIRARTRNLSSEDLCDIHFTMDAYCCGHSEIYLKTLWTRIIAENLNCKHLLCKVLRRPGCMFVL